MHCMYISLALGVTANIKRRKAFPSFYFGSYEESLLERKQKKSVPLFYIGS